MNRRKLLGCFGSIPLLNSRAENEEKIKDVKDNIKLTLYEDKPIFLSQTVFKEISCYWNGDEDTLLQTLTFNSHLLFIENDIKKDELYRIFFKIKDFHYDGLEFNCNKLEYLRYKNINPFYLSARSAYKAYKKK